MNRKYIVDCSSLPSKSRDSTENQDHYCFAEVNSCKYFALADGMSTLDFPDQASYLAATTSINYLLSHRDKKDNTLESIVAANDIILNIDPAKDLGTTLTVFQIFENLLTFSHIGDCRLLLYKQNKCEILTQDHSMLAKKLEINNPSVELVVASKSAKNLYKSLGDKVFDASYIQNGGEGIILNKGDLIIACSDGLWTELSEEEMFTIVQKDFSNGATNLASEAYKRDSSDDITCITVYHQ